jgi:hypothetical protein
MAAPRDIARKLPAFVKGVVPVQIKRLAVTPEQIATWQSPTRPTKTGGSHAKGFTGESDDLDAIPL